MPPSMSTQRNIGVALSFLRLAQQGMGLLGVLDIALEEDDAAGTERVEHDAQARRHLGPVKAHDEQLANLTAKFETVLGSHKE